MSVEWQSGTVSAAQHVDTVINSTDRFMLGSAGANSTTAAVYAVAGAGDDKEMASKTRASALSTRRMAATAQSRRASRATRAGKAMVVKHKRGSGVLNGRRFSPAHYISRCRSENSRRAAASSANMTPC